MRADFIAVGLLALVETLLFAPLAGAQSLAGPYVGGYIGGGSGDAHWEIAGSNTLDQSPNGGMLGVQGGYNWIIDRWLLGAQGDLGIGRIQSSSRCPNVNFECKTEVLSLYTARGRVGRVFDNFAPYVTVGIAGAGIRTSVDNGFSRDEDAKGHGGWTAGIGVVGLIGQHLTWQVEYLRVDLGSQDHILFGVTNKVDASLDMLRVGLHYKFF